MLFWKSISSHPVGAFNVLFSNIFIINLNVTNSKKTLAKSVAQHEKYFAFNVRKSDSLHTDLHLLLLLLLTVKKKFLLSILYLASATTTKTTTTATTTTFVNKAWIKNTCCGTNSEKFFATKKSITNNILLLCFCFFLICLLAKAFSHSIVGCPVLLTETSSGDFNYCQPLHRLWGNQTKIWA